VGPTIYQSLTEALQLLDEASDWNQLVSLSLMLGFLILQAFPLRQYASDTKT